jgi:nucleoside-triphosphatase
MKRVLLITGVPGVGKTTVLTKTVGILREKGFTVGGMLSREVRENGVRVGFEIIDISSEKHGWLAHVNQQTGPRVGKYRVNIIDLDDVGAKAIIDAIENCYIVAIDEIGPMELFSKRFKDAVNASLQSQKAVMAVVHARARDILISEVKARKDAEIFEVTHQNRDHLPETIAEKTLPKPFKNPN